MPTDKISIELNMESQQLEIKLPLKKASEGAKLSLMTRLGETIERLPLQAGMNRISLKNTREKIIVVRVETAFETIVKEVEY